MTDDRTATMTLQELWDWKDKLRSKRRGPTKSEELDWEECNRQINEVASETTMDWEEAERDERYMDTCPSPTQRSHPAWTPRYQDARNARKRPLSPPSTPPPLRGSKQQHAGLELYMGNSRIDKRIKRKATRCPTTRTYGVPAITLHHRKGYIYFWHTSWEYVVISYEQYLRDYVSAIPLCCLSSF